MTKRANAVQLLRVPYDSGRAEARMGAGPSALTRAGAGDRLRARGHSVCEQQLDPTPEWRAELKTAFELHRQIAAAARSAHHEGRVPLLLSGNCSGTIGMLAALSAATSRRVGLVWLDAHGDFNTPDTDPYGFLDGQGLAMVVGRCWRTLTATVPGFTPLPERAVVLAGARDVDDQEAPALRDSGITWLDPSQVRDMPTVQEAVQRLADVADVVHVHVDLDVHDPTIAPANGFAAPNGLTANEVHEVIRQLAESVPIASGTLASYDPSYDPAGRMRDIALDLLALIAELTTTTART
ncbi:arginase family protein [Georgenia sp. TF02-10]|uniref:arginase family protein n=1 Tax=Georgenia sp. TF02-10 TaxID=2917725 RepID=UPI001FA6FE05|nr:arginase family protein [Georgenia sp. TF02-10]UNX56201.1 arginase family protein [Georgenia sp. TF02-10]